MSTPPLIPDDLRQRLPPLRGQEGNRNPMVYALLHRPGEYQAWLITELEDDAAFGWVIDHDDGAFGEFYLSALVAELPSMIQIWEGGDRRAFPDPPHKHPVTHDPAFTPRKLQDARDYYDALWQRENE